MKKLLFVVLILAVATAATPTNAFAKGTRGQITGKSVVAGLLSLIIWPGIGQAVNDNKGDKVLTHAIIGLLPPFRFWSGYDGLYDRTGGYWEGRI